MKNKPKTQNPHTQKIIATQELLDNEKFEHKLDKTFSHKPHSQQWIGSYRAAEIYSYISNSYSFLTGGFAVGFVLFMQFKNIMPYTLAATLTAFLAFGLAFLLEILKRNTNSNFFAVGFSDYWSKATGTAVLMLMTLSIGLSFYASIHLPSATASSPKLENIDSLKAANLAELATLESKRNDFRADRLYLGKLASKDAKIVKQYDDDIKELKKVQNHVITSVTAKNDHTLLMHQNRQNEWGYTLGYIAIVLELLFILSFWYQYRFLWNSYLERSEHSLEEEEQKIGFQKWSSQTGGEKAPSAQKSIQINFGAKEAQSHVITSATAPQLIKNTVTHEHFINGKTKEVGMLDIKRNIDTYAVRVDDSLTKLRNGQNELILKELNNRISKHQYWTGKLLELTGNYEKAIYK
ncbi:MAG: hypothetical protein GY810_16535 [Aureispira sp.]|nr:hypothetical protein [Aureispira sp.]